MAYRRCLNGSYSTEECHIRKTAKCTHAQYNLARIFLAPTSLIPSSIFEARVLDSYFAPNTRVVERSVMALLSELFSVKLSISGSKRASVKWIWNNFCCHSDDEVYVEGTRTEGVVPPFASAFIPEALDGHLLAVGDEDGVIRFLDTRKRAAHPQFMRKEIEAHKSPVFDLACLSGTNQLVTGSGDLSVAIWDLVSGTQVTQMKSHAASVRAVQVNKFDPSVLASAGRDGNIFVWDIRCNKRGAEYKPVNSLYMAHAVLERSKTPRTPISRNSSIAESKFGVTGLAFLRDNKLASAGAADGVVKIWDMRYMYSNCRSRPAAYREFTPVTGAAGRPYGFTHLTTDPFCNYLFASCMDDTIYAYESSGTKSDPVFAYGGHKVSSFYVKCCTSSDGRYLLSGSSCSKAFIWEVSDPQAPPTVLQGHVKEVTTVSWCPTQADKVVTCSDNSDLRIWRVSNDQFSPGTCVGSASIYEGKDHLRCIQQSSSLKRQSPDFPLPTLYNYFATPCAASPSCCVKVDREVVPGGQSTLLAQAAPPLSPMGGHSFVHQFTSAVTIIADDSDSIIEKDVTPKRKRGASSRLVEGTKRRRLHEGRGKENMKDSSFYHGGKTHPIIRRRPLDSYFLPLNPLQLE